MTPLKWLHMTTTIIGSAAEVNNETIKAVVNQVRDHLAAIEPVHVSIGHFLYHPEAVMLAVEPKGSLVPIRQQIQMACRTVLGSSFADEPQWTPHITLCYSTDSQPAKPIISKLGRSFPAIQATVESVTLVVQDGPERAWNWHPVETVRLGASAAQPTEMSTTPRD